MWIPKPGPDGKRRYRQWAGNPVGNVEDITRCIVPVADEGRSPLSHQCYRKRGHGENGEYCAIHAKKMARSAAMTSALSKEPQS